MCLLPQEPPSELPPVRSVGGTYFLLLLAGYFQGCRSQGSCFISGLKRCLSTYFRCVRLDDCARVEAARVSSCLLLRFSPWSFCSYHSDVSSCHFTCTYILLGICYIESVALFPFVLENPSPSSSRQGLTVSRLSLPALLGRPRGLPARCVLAPWLPFARLSCLRNVTLTCLPPAEYLFSRFCSLPSLFGIIFRVYFLSWRLLFGSFADLGAPCSSPQPHAGRPLLAVLSRVMFSH